MTVQVSDALPGVRALIDHEAVATLGETKFLGDLSRCMKKVPQDLHVGGGRVVNAADVLLGNHQRVHRGDGPNVFERNDVFVLEDDLRGGGPRDDVAK
jgi:hypothetical protein